MAHTRSNQVSRGKLPRRDAIVAKQRAYQVPLVVIDCFIWAKPGPKGWPGMGTGMGTGMGRSRPHSAMVRVDDPARDVADVECGHIGTATGQGAS